MWRGRPRRRTRQPHAPRGHARKIARRTRKACQCQRRNRSGRSLSPVKLDAGEGGALPCRSSRPAPLPPSCDPRPLAPAARPTADAARGPRKPCGRTSSKSEDAGKSADIRPLPLLPSTLLAQACSTFSPALGILLRASGCICPGLQAQEPARPQTHPPTLARDHGVCSPVRVADTHALLRECKGRLPGGEVQQGGTQAVEVAGRSGSATELLRGPADRTATAAVLGVREMQGAHDTKHRVAQGSTTASPGADGAPLGARSARRWRHCTQLSASSHVSVRAHDRTPKCKARIVCGTDAR